MHLRAKDILQNYKLFAQAREIRSIGPRFFFGSATIEEIPRGRGDIIHTASKPKLTSALWNLALQTYVK